MRRLHLCAVLALGTPFFGCDLGGSSGHGGGSTGGGSTGNGGGCNVSPSSGSGWGTGSGLGSGLGSGFGSGSGSQASPPDLTFDSDLHRVVRGGTLRIEPTATPSLDQWTITVDDPGVLRATPGEYSIDLDAIAPGTTTLHAQYGDRLVSYDLTVVAAAKLEVRVVQPAIRPAPTTHVTAIAGSTDFLEITYLDADGNVLAGTGAAHFTGDVGVTSGVPGFGPLAAATAPDGTPRDYPEFSFGTGGHVIAAGDFGMVPIEVAVVPRPDRVELTLGLAFWDAVHVATITGQTTAGEPIAGVTATWTIAPTDHILSEPESGAAQQLFALPDSSFHGTVTITARVDPLTATTMFDVP